MGPWLLSHRISWEQNKDGKNVLENKAVSGSRGLSSDIALWLLISAWWAQPWWLENTHCSFVYTVLLTANPLKLIYGLRGIFDFCIAFSERPEYDTYNTSLTYWLTTQPQCEHQMFFITGILTLKFIAIWNDGLWFWSLIWNVTQHYKQQHTDDMRFQSYQYRAQSLMLEVLNPAQQLSTSREHTEPPPPPGKSRNTVGSLRPFIQIDQTVFCTSDGAVMEIK